MKNRGQNKKGYNKEREVWTRRKIRPVQDKIAEG